MHEHNEVDQVNTHRRLLDEGKRVVLVSDAGTPLISDPGYRVVSDPLRGELSGVSDSGACALVAALSASGLPSDVSYFLFWLKERAREALAGFRKRRGQPFSNRRIVLERHLRIWLRFSGASELCWPENSTKTLGDVFRGHLGQCMLCAMRMKTSVKVSFRPVAFRCWGTGPVSRVDIAVDDLLKGLMGHLPVKQVAALVSKLSGAGKNELYQRALALKDVWS